MYNAHFSNPVTIIFIKIFNWWMEIHFTSGHDTSSTGLVLVQGVCHTSKSCMRF